MNTHGLDPETFEEQVRISNEINAEILTEPVQCLCGRTVPLDSHWFDDRVSGVKFCSQSCAEEYGDKNENGEKIP